MSAAVPVSSRIVLRAVCLSLLFLAVTALASAACDGPSSPGIRICYPSANSTVTYPATLEIGSNLGAATVSAVKVYDNGKQINSLAFLPSALTNGGVYNGAHHVVVNVWDSNGKLYQASANFSIVGFGNGACKSANVGVNICAPEQGQLVPNLSAPISMKANGASGSKITAWKLYLDNKLVMTSQIGSANSLSTGLSVSAGTHRLVINAWDSNGKLYQATRTFTAFYEHDCNPKNGACTPGIVINSPANVAPWGAQDVPAQFRLQADVVLNSAPTTKMQVELDGAVVETNTGPGITAEMHPAAGSHIVSVRAWDTAGKMYATYGTINVE